MRPKGRWTGVRPAEGKEGYFEVRWPTVEPSNSRGTKMATHRGEDVVSLFKVLKSHFEDQGKKYYSPEEVDNLVREALESASSGNTQASPSAAGLQDQIDGLKKRLSWLELSVQAQPIQPPIMSSIVSPVAPPIALTDPKVVFLASESAAKYLGIARTDFKKAASEATNELRAKLGVADDETPYSRSFYGLAKDALKKLMA